MSTLYRKPDQIIQPYYFGDPQQKSTCLWFGGVSRIIPKLIKTNIVEPEIYYYKDGKKKGRGDPAWHVDSMKLAPIERMKFRSKTFQGVANAMAAQWSDILQVLLYDGEHHYELHQKQT